MSVVVKSDPPEFIEDSVKQLYRHRFPEEMLQHRIAVWKALCNDWFSRYIPPSSRVLEVAAGYCEFINNINAAERVAVDLNPESKDHASPGVTVHEVAAESLADILPHDYFDVAFMSNFLEHCRSREQLLQVLRAVATVLKPGGRILILGPNFRYCYKDYYDFFDHHLALTEKAVVEALNLEGFSIQVVQPRTLPYTFKGRLPSAVWLVRLYLRLPFVWRLLGAQFFVVGRKADL